MSDGDKAAELKGSLKKKEGHPVSVEEMNEVIREQGGNAMNSLEAENIVDLLNDVDGGDVEFEPVKLGNCFKLPKT